MSGTEGGEARRVWIPVCLKGFRMSYEMSPEGFVRRRESDGQGRWLIPEHGAEAGKGPGYWLGTDQGRAWLDAGRVFAAFGLALGPDAGWLERTARAARLRNRVLEERARLRDPLGALLQEAEGDALTALLATLARGCPWERSRIGGDARGADPVLGF